MKHLFDTTLGNIRTMIREGEIHIALVLSTGHITKQEDAWLNQVAHHRHAGPIVRDMEPGWLINLPVMSTDPEGDLKAVEAHKNLHAIYAAAYMAGYTHLRLDPDGPVSTEFPTYAW